MEQKILDYFKAHEEEIFDDLKTLVAVEASTSDIEALQSVRSVLKGIITERTKAPVTEHHRDSGHDVLEFEAGEGAERLLIVGHYDTVHPIGAFQMHQEENRLYGPGVYDMKSGVISAIWMVKAFQDLGIDPGKKLVFLFNGDEETGSKASEDVIREKASGARAALICEPSTRNGDLKTGRKGTLGFTVQINGKASHAGMAHKDGISAIEEMAHEILAVQGLTDYEKGTTLSVGVCEGGTKANVVPAHAKFIVDCRYQTKEEGMRVRNAIVNMEVTVKGTDRQVMVEEGRPPMEQTAANLALFEIAQACGEKLGMSFSHQFVGGGSDGNLTADMGIPTLDGLGSFGDDAHTEKEYLVVDQFVPRMALLASLVYRI